jgi:hypothetical protein
MGRNITTSSDSAFITVPTATGFNAGDLVYNQSGGYGALQTSTVTSATFPIGGSGSPVLTADATNQAQITWAEYAGSADYSNGAAALLTSGNIVIPYALNATQAAGTFPYFRIVNSAGTTVVAQTQVDTTNRPTPVQQPAIGALALPNGNFVVYYQYTTGGNRRLAFRIFNASGVAQTAVITDTTMNFPTNNAQDIHAVARSDSSFVVIGGNADVGTPFYRVYNGTTGATVYSGSWGSNLNNLTGSFDVVVRSDNSWVMVQLNPYGSIFWEVRSATNVQSAASSYGTGYSSGGVSAVLLAGDTVRLFYTAGSYIGTNLLTGTTMGSETNLFNTGNQGIYFPVISAYAYDSGTKFIITAGANGIGGGYSAAGTAFLAFSSGLAQLSAGTTSIPLGMFTWGYSLYTFLEVGNTIRCYKPTRLTTAQATTALSGAGIAYVAIDKTTLLPVNQQSTPYSYGNTGLLPVSGYSAATATPTQISFLASTTSIQTVSSAQSAFLLPQTIVESVACNSAQVVSLPNGQFAYLYKASGSPFTIKLAIYNSAGTQTNIVTVDTGADTVNGARMTVLSNGKIMVIYVQGGALRCKVYSTALTQLATTQIAASIYTSVAYANIAISALGVAGRAVIGYINPSSASFYAVVDDTGTVVNSAQVNTSVGFVAVCGSRTDTFVFGSAGTPYVYAYYPTSSTVYTQLSNRNIGNNYTPPFGIHMEASPDNNIMFGFTGYQSITLLPVDGGDISLQNNTAGYNNYFGTSNYTQVAIGRTATNVNFVFTTGYGGSANNIYYTVFIPNNISSPRGNIQITGLSCSTTNSCPTIAPFVADSSVMSLINSSGFPTFFAFVPYASTQYSSITAGSSLSNPVTLSPANRFVLVGVAATTAAANSTGIVQTKGNAQVNSSYSATTAFQGFDFRNQTTFGAAGTIVGRTVVLEN